MSRWRMPAACSTLHAAFMVALRAPTVPASPTPFIPSGFKAVGVSRFVQTIIGRSVDLGIA
jgi:hypothetical protein